MSVGAVALCAWRGARSCSTAGRTSASGAGWLRCRAAPCPLLLLCAQNPQSTNHACSYRFTARLMLTYNLGAAASCMFKLLLLPEHVHSCGTLNWVVRNTTWTATRSNGNRTRAWRRDHRRFPEFGLLSRSGRFTEVIDVLVITHFHTDHIGALPYFTEVRSGVRDRITDLQ